VIPGVTTVVLRDYRSRWDGVVTKVVPGPRLERSVSPGEIAVFEPTGEEVPHTEVHHLRGGVKEKVVNALIYQRTHTRLV
jgi:hypothetical protein